MSQGTNRGPKLEGSTLLVPDFSPAACDGLTLLASPDSGMRFGLGLLGISWHRVWRLLFAHLHFSTGQSFHAA